MVAQVNRLSQAHLAVSVTVSLSTVVPVRHHQLLVVLVLLALASTRILAAVVLVVDFQRVTLWQTAALAVSVQPIRRR